LVNRGVVGEDADPQSVEARRGDQAFGPEQHGVTRALAGRGTFGARDEDEASKPSCWLASSIRDGEDPSRRLKLRSSYGSRRRGRPEELREILENRPSSRPGAPRPRPRHDLSTDRMPALEIE
jgi:hypothetical protein